jgi:hypothetical protein
MNQTNQSEKAVTTSLMEIMGAMQENTSEDNLIVAAVAHLMASEKIRKA